MKTLQITTFTIMTLLSLTLNAQEFGFIPPLIDDVGFDSYAEMQAFQEALESSTASPSRNYGCSQRVSGQGIGLYDDQIAYTFNGKRRDTRIGLNEESLNIVVDMGCRNISSTRRDPNTFEW